MYGLGIAQPLRYLRYQDSADLLDLQRCNSVSQKIWLNLDLFRNCREFNSVWRISLAFANRPLLHYGNGLRNIGGEAPPAQIKVPSAFGKYAPFSIKAPPAR